MSFISYTGSPFLNSISHVLPVGTIIFSAISTDSIPEDWKLCDGSELSAHEYPELFNTLKHKFGGAAYRFKVPNLVGRVIVGEDKDRLIIKEPFKNTFTEIDGELTHLLLIDELATHNHIGKTSITGDKKSGAYVNYSSSDPDGGNPVLPRIETTESGEDAAHNNMQPYFVMRFIIKVKNIIWKEVTKLSFTNISFNSPIGSIFPCASENVPDGWLLCNGQQYHIHAYPDLFNVLQNTWGNYVPDLRGRVLVGADPMATVISSNNTLANFGGEEKHLLNFFELANHNHSFYLSNTIGDYNYTHDYENSYPTDASNAPEPLTPSFTGKDKPHNNLQPYAVVNYIIKAKEKATPLKIDKGYEFISSHAILTSNIVYFIDASNGPKNIYLSSDYKLNSKVTIRKIDSSINSVSISDQDGLLIDFSPFYSISGSQPITIIKTTSGWLISQL